MFSAKNSLKVFVSPLISNTIIGDVDSLLEGELGFFNVNTGLLTASGAGYFAMKKNGIVVKSPPIAAFAGWAGVQAYAAPTMQVETITIPTPVVGDVFQISVEIKIPGMRGEFTLYGNFTAVDTVAANVATGLAASLNAELAREGHTDLFTVAVSTADVIITEKLQTYVKGHLPGRFLQVKSRLTLPVDSSAIATLTTPHADGVGYGPHILEQEYFAAGESDQYRYQEWRNNFEYIPNAVASGTYKVIVLTEENQVKTANARVDAPIQILIAFQTNGKTPAPTIDAAVNGDTAVTGVAYPGSSVILSVDGSPEAAVSAHGTTGIFSVTVTVATGDVLTATAQSGVLGVSEVSNAVIVTAT